METNRSKGVLRTLVLVAVGCAGLIPGMAWGQGVTGTVTGTVQDSSGAVVPGATVVLISEAQKTRTSPVVSNSAGDFVVANLVADTYTVQVEMPSFKTLSRPGVSVGPGTRVSVGKLIIEVGGASESITVTSEIPLIQTTSGERSFRVEPDKVMSLPLANRTYDALLGLAPGVDSNPGGLTPASRTGSNASNNFMVDGVTAIDPAINRVASRVSVEAVAEVKVVTSSYQAEYGRASGLQINAVTKSGTNQFHGSLYDVENQSKWSANSKTRILNGQPKPVDNSRDWGYAIGGPVGKPGGNNKLFFYYNQEFNPRTQGGAQVTYRLPTLLERQGDFSQSTDNTGAVYNLIKDPSIVGGTCTAANTTGCFAANAAGVSTPVANGGILGKIPTNRLYAPGIAILNWWPKPNLDAPPAGQSYNYQALRDNLSLLGFQPIIRLDYQPIQNLRGSIKYFKYIQPNKIIIGSLPGWNDTRQDDYSTTLWASSINWTMSSTMFAEFTWGRNAHHQEGCSINGGEPSFCDTGNNMNDIANRDLAGMGGIPDLIPDARTFGKESTVYKVLSHVKSKALDASTGRVVLPPTFAWGTRVSPAPPNQGGAFTNSSFLGTVGGSTTATLTKVSGSHTIKGGYSYVKAQQYLGSGGTFLGSLNFANDTTNTATDTTFGFANAAIGGFSSYSQNSTYGVPKLTGVNHEMFIQDNWKVRQNLTLDYGLRFVHESPQWDDSLRSSTFAPDRWNAANAPQVYVYTCVGASPCSGTNRRLMNPANNQLVAASLTTTLAGTLVPGVGDPYNGILAIGNFGYPGEGVISKTTYTFPVLGYAPRVGAAWDLKGDQRLVLRGGGGLFFDRPDGNHILRQAANPPYVSSVTLRFGDLRDVASTGVPAVSPPSLNATQRDLPLPKSAQWNGEMQMALPWLLTVSGSYTGSHDYDRLQSSQFNGIDINIIDLGMAYDSKYQDPTLAVNGVTNSLVNTNPNQIRAYRGYSSIATQLPISWRTYHSIQLSVNRALRNGLRFTFNDTINLSDKQSVAPRIEHHADGSFFVRADQAEANKLLGDAHPRTHALNANFIWSLPKLVGTTTLIRTVGAVVNDWTLAGIWTGSTGAPYQPSFTYTSNGANINLTGSPDYAARIVVLPNVALGGGCSKDPLRQFNISAFAGPQDHSVGLESGTGYLKGCFQSKLDLSISRTLHLGKSRQLQLRADLFNALNQARITGRASSLTFASPTSNLVPTNSPFNPDGSVIDSRSKPTGAGVGVANAYQAPRSVQVQVRFQF